MYSLMKSESQTFHVSHILTMLGRSHYETLLVTCTFQKLSLCFVIRFVSDKTMVTIWRSFLINSSETRYIMDWVGRGNYDTAPFPNIIIFKFRFCVRVCIFIYM